MVWEILEVLALASVVAGGYMMFGPIALIVGGLLVLALSAVVNRRGGAA